MPRKRSEHRGERPLKERRPQRQKHASSKQNGRLMLYGKHAVEAALNNSRRTIHGIYAAARYEPLIKEVRPAAAFHSSTAADIAQRLPTGAVHQDIAAHVAPLEQPALETLIDQAPNGPLLMLDQVTDPHNIGAIFRSAAAFGVGAIIMQDKHAPAETGTLAKTASGALEVVPWVSVVNLSRALETLAQAGYWSVGLSGYAQRALEQELKTGQKTCLVLGAEGAGLRRNIETHCDSLAKLDIDSRMESLNVSNAAAVALYITRRALTA